MFLTPWSWFPQFDVNRIWSDDDARDVAVDHGAIGKVAIPVPRKYQNDWWPVVMAWTEPMRPTSW
jgi:hypothetical protein